MRVISGGQVGVDRLALDVATSLGLKTGGWCPRGRRAEDGVIPARYKLKETLERSYASRTKKNVEDSDATLILEFGRGGSPGTGLTKDLCDQLLKPMRVVRLTRDGSTLNMSVDWVTAQVETLNVAGPRIIPTWAREMANERMRHELSWIAGVTRRRETADVWRVRP